MSVPLYDTLGTEAIGYIIDKGKVQQYIDASLPAFLRATSSVCTCFCSFHLDDSVWRAGQSQSGTELREGQGALRENHHSNGDPQCGAGRQGATGWDPHPQPAGDGGQQAHPVHTSVFPPFLICLFYVHSVFSLQIFGVVCSTLFAFFLWLCLFILWYSLYLVSVFSH